MYKSLQCFCGYLPTYKNQLHISILSWKFGWTFKNPAISHFGPQLMKKNWSGLEFLMEDEELQTFSCSIIVNPTKNSYFDFFWALHAHCTFYWTFCKERSQKTPKFGYQTHQFLTFQILWKWPIIKQKDM